MANLIIAVVLAPAIVLISMYFYSLRRLFAVLEREQPAYYDSIGRPSLFLRNSPQSGFKITKALWAREMERFGGEVSPAAVQARRMYVASGGYYIVMFSAVICVLLLGRH